MGYIDRDGNEIDWARVSRDSNYPFGSEVTNEIYGRNDIIDILLMGWDGTFYSVNPQTFKDIVASKNDSRTTKFYPICKTSNDHYMNEAPLNLSVTVTQADIFKLSKQITGGKEGGSPQAGAWYKNKSGDKLIRLDSTNAKMSDINYEAIRLLEDRDKKGEVTGGWTKCTELAIQFSRVSELSNAMYRGYQMFVPDNITHSYNWVQYKMPKSEPFLAHLLVLYLTMPRLLLENKFLTPEDPPSAIKSMMKSSTAKNAIINLVNDVCTKSIPESYVRLNAGDHFMGTTIYSPDSNFKLLVQPDGNVVVYKTGGDAIWSSDTFAKDYIFPRVAIENDGSFIVWGRNNASKRVSPVIGTKTYLTIDSSNGILTLRDAESDIPRWASVSSKEIYKNIYPEANVFKPITDYNARDEHIRYSPNMKYFLKFQSDGNLTVNRSKDGKPHWASHTHGNDSATLSIQMDGNVVIYKDKPHESDPIWTTNTGTNNPAGIGKSTFLAVDNNGSVVVFVKTGDGLILRWSNANDPKYYSLDSGLQASELSASPMAFSRACTTAAYDQTVNSRDVLIAQAEWCANGLNILDDKCKKFRIQDDNQDIKNIKIGSGGRKGLDSYIQDIICSDGYDTRYPNLPNIQKDINKLCSCVNPIGDSKKILKSGFHPKCYDKACVETGYKTVASYSMNCPKCLCIADMNLSNLQYANNIKQTCDMDCENIGKETGATGMMSSNPEGSISFKPENVFQFEKDYFAGESDIIKNSPNGKFGLKFEKGGDLVLYTVKGNAVIWRSSTGNNSSAVLSIQKDNNIVIYKNFTKTTALWATGTNASDSSVFLAPDNNGNVVVYSMQPAGYKVLWVRPNEDLARYTPNSSISYIDTEQQSGPSGAITFKSENVFERGIDYASTNIFVLKKSPNQNYSLVFQSDGNLVLYKYDESKPIWNSGTGGNSSAILSVEKDNNVVIYQDSTKTKILWKTGTNSNAISSFLAPDDNGNVVVFSKKPGEEYKPVWVNIGISKYVSYSSIVYVVPIVSSNSKSSDSSTLPSGQKSNSESPDSSGNAKIPITFIDDNVYNFQTEYNADDIKKKSPNGAYSLSFQSDGNLVLYKNDDSSVVWSAGSGGNTSAVLSIQKDNNVVIYKDKSKIVKLWESKTTSTTAESTFLAPDNKGHVVIYSKEKDSSFKPVWVSTGLSAYTPNSTINYTIPITDTKLSDLEIAGIIAGVFVVLIIIIGIMYLRKKSPQQQAPFQQAPFQQAPFQQAPFQQAPFQQAPFPFQQAPFQQAPFQQAPFQQVPFQQVVPQSFTLNPYFR